MRDTTLIDALKNMVNGDAISDIEAFNNFVKDFISYMDDMYGMEQSEVMDECGLMYISGRR